MGRGETETKVQYCRKGRTIMKRAEGERLIDLGRRVKTENSKFPRANFAWNSKTAKKIRICFFCFVFLGAISGRETGHLEKCHNKVRTNHALIFFLKVAWRSVVE